MLVDEHLAQVLEVAAFALTLGLHADHASERERLSFLTAAATVFFSEFLRVNPFADGNGRTAK